MTDAEQTEFRNKLLKLQADLGAETLLTKDSRNTVILDQQAIGRLSRMDALQQQAMANAGQARRDATQTRIKAALQRMEEDEYGFCTECGEEIPMARLDLDPAIATCVTCATG